MPVYVAAFLIGVIAGLRALTAPTAVSWAARLGRLHLESSPLAFLGYTATPYIFSLLAVGELINDKLPQTPSRKVPVQFAVRIITGAFSGAAIGLSYGSLLGGLLAGILGAVAGTLGGAAARSRLTKAFGGNDLPSALTEDAVAILGSVLIISTLP